MFCYNCKLSHIPFYVVVLIWGNQHLVFRLPCLWQLLILYFIQSSDTIYLKMLFPDSVGRSIIRWFATAKGNISIDKICEQKLVGGVTSRLSSTEEVNHRPLHWGGAQYIPSTPTLCNLYWLIDCFIGITVGQFPHCLLSSLSPWLDECHIFWAV